MNIMPLRFFRHILLLSLIIFSFVNEGWAAVRPLSAQDKAHTREAFYFVERDNWREALLHARRAQNPLVSEYMTWRVLRNSQSEFDFYAYRKFLERNPNWPDQNRLVQKAEDRMLAEGIANIPAKERLEWFGRFPPISGKGKIAYAYTLGSGGKATQLVRDGWINGDFDTSQEQYLLRNYAHILRQQDHIARIDRLLWEGKTTPASRLFFAVPKGYQSLFEARIRLALDRPGIDGALSQVPSDLKQDPGLQYERMKWRERKGGMDSAVREILLAVKDSGPLPEKWWPSRHKQVRNALDAGQVKLALNLLDKQAQTNSANLADALFLQGWIHLTKLKQPAKALPYFEQLDKAVSFPVSKARAAYWLGRSHEALGQQQQAQRWYASGADYPTTFYGQLCHGKRSSAGGKLSIPSFLAAGAQEKKQFEEDRRVQVAHMLASAGREKDALTFINFLANEPSTHGRAALVADLGTAIGRADFSVIAAKEILKQNIVLPQHSYPYFSLNFAPEGEEALIWAITRQESQFDPQAESKAGAKGLMQLLPSTAREVARKRDLPYTPSTLGNPLANVRLGDAYINQLVRQFDGSYILAIASYNAGQGRARQWQRDYGDVGRTVEQAVDWIEGIPFSETRNYVQRVLENLQVYRTLHPKGKGNQDYRLEKDLLR